MRAMRDSGVESFGRIPESWDVVKFKTLFTQRKERNRGDEELLSVYLDRGVISYADSDGMQVHKPSEDMSKYQRVHVGDFVLNNQQAWRGSVGVSRYDGIVSPAYVVLRMSSTCNPSYMDYLLRNGCMYQQYEVCSRGVGTIQRNIFLPWLMNCYLALPPLDEQRRIADYLDARCVDIDAISQKVRSEIDLLGEYRKSVIYEAVAKGLDKGVPMRDSGIEWVGEMPEGWDTLKGKYVLTLLQRSVRPDDGVITCFRDGEVTLRSNRREDGFTMADREIGYQGINAGDLVIHGMDGFAGAIGISDSRGKGSPVLIVLDSEQNKRYLMYYIRCMAMCKVFEALSTGIRVRSCDLSWQKLANLPFPIPPLDEQRRIADYLDARCSDIDAIIAKKRQQLDVLADYRKSLIYECVTGKREVA